MTSSLHVLRELFNVTQVQPQKVALVLDDQVWTYSELLENVKCVACHLHSLNIAQGQIIYQVVERSFEMICGLLGIMFARGVYFPINPTEPSGRVAALLEQIQGQYILLHGKTRHWFPSAVIQHIISLDTILLPLSCSENMYDLPVCDENGPAYIICTSGTTGRQKAVVHTHKSFSASNNVFAQKDVGLYTARDQVLQVASCSWNLHLEEIALPLSVGGTLVLLRPGGNLDMAYFSQTLIYQQITTLLIGPGIIRALTSYIEKSQQLGTFQFVHNLCITGEPMKPREWTKFINLLSSSNLRVFVQYGMSECSGVLGCQLLNINDTVIPLGYPFPGVRCLLINEQDQMINHSDNSSDIGQIHIGGSVLFNGYLNDPERTANMFVTINNELYLKTGDLARYNVRGELVHAGRIDFQIKIRGQRVETAEIEHTIMSFSSAKIFNCLVIKAPQNDDLLVAYIISNDLELNTRHIQDYCKKHLRQYMVPTLFIVLEQFPLNASGKIDRKLLPTPDLSNLPTIINDHEYAEPSDEVERIIHSLWCEILGCSRISTYSNFFSIGGHSLLFIQLYQGYKTTFDFDISTINISELFQHPTIISHAYLFRQRTNMQQTSTTSLFPVDDTKIQTSDFRKSPLDAKNISFILSNDFINESDVISRYLPFPCTEVQQAYLFGRHGYAELGQVSCFEYQEYDLPSHFNIERFEQAVNQLIVRYEALRVIFISDTEQKILEKTPYYTIPISDLCDDTCVKETLIKRRMQLSHQVRPANQWPLFDFQLTRFINNNEYQFRLHIGFDLLIADLWSFNLIFSQLSQFYHNPDIILPAIKYSHRDYILAQCQMKNTLVYQKDKKYWMDRLHLFPFGTRLPLRCSLKELKAQRFIRLQQILDRSIWNQLKQRISNAQLTPAGFLTSIYAIVLAKWSNDQHFAINLPIFNRLPIHPQVNQIAGDFTSIMPLEIHLEQKLVFSQFVQTIQKQLWNDLTHMSYDGISFIRELMHINQTREIALPIVFMCGLFNSDNKDNTSKMRMLFEKDPVYSISQTPQVYLDNQVFEEDGQLIVRWDHVESLFPTSLIDGMQDAFINLLHRSALSDEFWQQPIVVELPADQLHRRSVFIKTKWQSDVEAHLLHALVIEQAQRVPYGWAILSSRENLTYQQLINRVYLLAHHIQQQRQESNQIIAILMKKDWKQVVACLAILLVGAAYLPLDIDSPHNRLSQVLEETNVKFIITQSDCQHTFPHLTSILVDTFTYDNYPEPFPIKQQSSTDLAYVIYTSGSTGKPKGVMISHQAVLNTILDINSRLDVSSDDRIFALSHLNFDLSVYDIFGILIAGGTIVIPDHEHYKNPQHWYNMMTKHHVTIWNTVPMLMQMLVEHLQHTNMDNQLRHVLLSGDWIPLSLPKAIQTTFGEQVTITSLGGATEASIWSIAFTLPKEIPHEWKSIPYGMPLRNQHYYVYDMHLDDCPEWVNGELYIGGMGLADGYWNDREKTESSFILHPRTAERLYRTGDYGRFIPDGYIEFTGRKDFQVKVHGHRIELGEIEYNLQQHSDIHQAIVTLDRNSQLIGYIMPETYSDHNDDYDQLEIEITDPIERTNFKLARRGMRHQHGVRETFSLIKPKVTEKEWNEMLKAYLSEKLPAYMIPSYFMTVSSFPLSSNGKIDRNSLPRISMSVLEKEKTYIAPSTELEKTIANIWQQLLLTDRLALQHSNSKSSRFPSVINDTASNVSYQDSRTFSPLSTTTSFFDLGGDSLLLIQIYRHYHSLFNFNTETLTIRPFFIQNTLAEHAKLLESFVINNMKSKQWHTLHINESIASFAQERIVLDEQVRFSNKIAIYNELIALRIVQGSLSINRLSQALRFILSKQKILRTSLIFNHDEGILKQSITDKHLTYTLSDEQAFKNENELQNVIYQIIIDPNLFDLSVGRVFHCQIFRQQEVFNKNNDSGFITNSDVLLMAFHHSAFDGWSASVFLNELCKTYNSNTIWSDNEELLQYIDYSVHERLTNMVTSREFWQLQLDGYNLEHRLSLPVDRDRSSSDQRSGLASVAQISFEDDVTTSFLSYASSHQLTLFQLGLATFYAFLFKLTHSENDLCISCLNANRYRTELQNIIGMFVATLPHRIQIDPHWSFGELVEHVREKCLSVLEHSHYPLQHILADTHPEQSNVEFLETSFNFTNIYSNIDQLFFDRTILEQVPLSKSSEVAKFDFMLKLGYDSALNDGKLSCHFICSRDLFDEKTVASMARKLEHLLVQIFSKFSASDNGQSIIAISKLSLILPEEAKEMHGVLFHRLPNILNEAPASYAQARIWLDERIRFDPDKPSVAIYNMPFLYRLYPEHTLSIKQLRDALQLIVTKHLSLRTALIFDTETNRLMQRIIDSGDSKKQPFTFIESTFETDEQLIHIMYDEKRNSQLFDLAQGLVFRCHLLHHEHISSNNLLTDNDVIIFNFHHAMFDYPSMNLFLHDLNHVYKTDQLHRGDDSILRYLDYAVIEQQMPMAGASMFWLDTLHDCHLDRSLPLPYDRYRLVDEHRTGRGTSISFDFGQDLSHQFLSYASSNNMSLQYLAVTCYHAFLFKLTNGERDLCIGVDTHGRYKEELMSVIGMFVNAIPLRCQLDPHWSFQQLVQYVQEMMINSLEYSYFPLQRILAQHPNVSKAAFLDISFVFYSSENQNIDDSIVIGDSRLHSIPISIKISENEIMSKFDFALTLHYNQSINQLSCTIDASLDLFNRTTVDKIAQRFKSMLEQLFNIKDVQMNKPIYELSLILSDERLLMQSMNNTQVLLPSMSCIHHEFVCQAMKYSQKLAVELDNQSLTYSELLYYVQVLSIDLLKKQRLIVGEIVCQCVERSLSMVIGMLAIEMVGGVYCPLSPRDPQHRLQSLLEQSQSRSVLVHHLTRTKFQMTVISTDIDSVLATNDINSDNGDDLLANVLVGPNNIAYIIFTSGSTGTPKAVQVRHKNFVKCMHSLTDVDTFNKNDTVAQISRCSFDIHVQEIFGTLINGATLVMLHPRGTIDFEYLSAVLDGKQITYMHSVPSLLYRFFTYIQEHNNQQAIQCLRSLCSSGEPFTIKLFHLIVSIGMQRCRIWNLYGPAESTIDCTYHFVDITTMMESIPIGMPLPNYQCIIKDNFSQNVIINQEGELYVGGVGVFAGYLGRDDLTEKALTEIDGEIFYRTGDLVRIDNNGLLHYQGREDHQIKLHGQRIELGEIERCLLNTSISACVVMKWGDDHLVAYVQTSDMNETQLREYCQSQLPPQMIPSIFIILEKLPLNTNGKIDRKRLPPPSFSHLSSINSTNSFELLAPTNEMEVNVHHIWCDIFQQNQISIDTNIFTIGGHSLLLMQLFHRYKTQFHLQTNTLSIADLFQYPTIIGHSKLIRQPLDNTQNINQFTWSSLNIIQARPSFAQERIFLDEQIRFASKNNNVIYLIPQLYRITSTTKHVSIFRLRCALHCVITRHNILRTALYLDINGTIIQHCLDMSAIENEMKVYEFSVINVRDDDNDNIDKTINEIINHSNLFDLSQGRVIRCHVLRHCPPSDDLSSENDDLLSKDDCILFCMHHSAFDGTSTSIFLRDLALAYETNCSLPINDNTLQYTDYAVHERLMDTTLSREFWHLQLAEYNLQRPLSLLVDQHRPSTDQRSGLASAVQISFNNHISTAFLQYASSHQVTPFQLALTTFYAFLFKLTHGESDLCIASINANRYRPEIQEMIGMFVATLPYRIQLDSQWSFDQLVQHVREKCLSILEHSHYSLQHILADVQLNQSNVSFLEIMFDFITVSSDVDSFSLNGASLNQISIEQLYQVAKFDSMLTFVYNPTSDDHQLSCSLTCSDDLFDKTTVKLISQRFNYFLEQIFRSGSNSNVMDDCMISINKFSVILPEEAAEMEEIIFHRLEYAAKEAPASYAQTRIYLDERIRFDPDQPFVAIYNMPFLYRLSPEHTLSIKHLRDALQLIVTKHLSLRTSLIFDTETNRLMQRIIDSGDNKKQPFTFIESTFETNDQLTDIMHDEKRNSQHFTLAQGLVFRCHFVYHEHISSNDLLTNKDVIIFNFHHALFDVPSMNVFLHDLHQAYKTCQLLTNDDTVLRYLDYAIIEQEMPMTGASMFWLDILHDCHLDRSLPLPYDRYHLVDEHRTGRGTSVSFDFSQDLSHQFLSYASSNDTTLEYLALSCYYAFLFKLTNGERDLCIGVDTHGRYKEELMSVIGMFVNAIPLRCQLDPHWSFQQLVQYVQEMMINSLEYSYFPLQRILAQHPNVSKAAFLDISFVFYSSENQNIDDSIVIGDSRLHSIPISIKISENEIMSKFDFALTLHYNQSINQLSCTIDASLDLFFNRLTVDKIAQRFHSMLKQLFNRTDVQMNNHIYEFSLILPEEKSLMRSMNNRQVLFPPVSCIHHEFVSQTVKYSQKVAVELDNQSLTYSEVLYYVQVLASNLLSKQKVLRGDVICQCVERSLSMVIGMMAIQMVGGVYCPLSPRDPQQRLYALVKQTQSHLVLVHSLTKATFTDDIVLLEINALLTNKDVESDIDIVRLSNLSVTLNSIAYIIFTSGSTGTPKPVQIRHRNFTQSIRSLVHMDIFNENHTILQMGRCSFDIHVQEILGTLMIGGTVVMLRPRGNIDFDYLSATLTEKQISFIYTVPSLFQSIFTRLEETKNTDVVKFLRSVCTGGERCTVKLAKLIAKHINKYCPIWNLCGPAETTLQSLVHQVNLTEDADSISLGKPLPNYHCIIQDAYTQPVIIGQEGELLMAGVGIFAGYLGCDDLTEKALTEIDGEIFYRTGDLVRMDNNGLLHYQGRKDYQIKLHGQRIELGEIERCLLNTSISACVVMKWGDDHLVAYVQTSDMNEEQLRQHCQSHLPPHMIPSKFMVLEKLPLNANGKIDRKNLPPPTFSPHSSITIENFVQIVVPRDEIELIIHHIWCDVFQQNQISTNANIFSIGGHSLLLMQLFHRYKTQFNLEISNLSVADLFQYPTIIGHSQLIAQTLDNTQNIDDSNWSSLNIIQAPASFAQERIFLDEQIRFASKNNNAMYLIPQLYRITSTTKHVSISRLRCALHAVITRHNILRTALYLDINGTIIQHCLDMSAIENEMKVYEFSVINVRDDDNDNIDKTINEIINHSNLFDLTQGRVIHCHILRHCPPNDDLLSKDDCILFCIHHSAFDGTSTSIFLRDLSLAYETNCSSPVNDITLQYIDYAVHEHLMDTTSSRQFWHSQLVGYNLQNSLSLSADRHRSSTDQRSGLASSAQISFNTRISTAFLQYASSHQITLFQLGLATFYAFLFKLTHGERDLCITSINANRYRSELEEMIGMFVATLPYRIQLDSQWSFDQLVQHVREKCLSILEHSHYSLQHILADVQLNQSNVSFLETMFDFITVSSDIDSFSLDGASLAQISIEHSYQLAKFDFSLTFVYNPTSNDNQLSCSLVFSRDIFDSTTVAILSQRFEYFFNQVFGISSGVSLIDDCMISIKKLSVTLPEEAAEMQTKIFRRLENTVNEAPASYAQARIWLDERIRFDPDKPLVAIYNMPFLYRLYPEHTLSIKQLRNALQLIVTKHLSLRTSLIFDTETNRLMQRIIDSGDSKKQPFTFIESTFETDEQLIHIMYDEKRNSQLFDLAQGLVFRCHLLHHEHISSNNLLTDNDVIIFNFHHAMFDYPSMNLFLHDLNHVYKTDQLHRGDDSILRYLDYAVIEQQMPMAGASMFWLDTLHDCHLDRSLPLPYDRYRLVDEHRTGRGTSISFDFGQDLSHQFLSYASSNNMSLQYLAVTCYHAFLFKLTNGERDLCIGVDTHGRYKEELMSVIGMFVNAIPLRCQLDPHWSFQQLVQYVQEMMINSLEYSYFPLQRILAQHPNVSKAAFLDISFVFYSSENQNIDDSIVIGDSRLHSIPISIKISENEIMSKFDFALTLHYNQSINQLSCTIDASLDLFNRTTVDKIAQRFKSMLEQLFNIKDVQMNKPIYELSLILSDERLLMQSMNNTQVLLPSMSCIHHEFVCQAMKYSQKLAVELDNQSLTYSELLYYVQVLSIDLLKKQRLIVGEIVCQCVERSLSMVIGMLAIEMVGGVYCPLSPRDPQHRLQSLLEQSQSRSVLVHHLTRTKFQMTVISTDIDSVLATNDINSDNGDDLLANVLVGPNNIAYIIFTSGSTGTPKAVQVRHKNFVKCMHSLTDVDTFNKNDTVAQISRCSFDIHVQEIFGTLINGATLVMLHPRGTIDFEYLSAVLDGKQITYMHSVPSLLYRFFTYIQEHNNQQAIQCLRSLCSSGEPFTIKLFHLIVSIGMQRCRIWNLYGPAESTIACTYHFVDITTMMESIPIGMPLPNYQCIIKDNFSQNVIINQEGELYVGGVGVFAGYLGRDDSTEKALIEVDGEIFYRTGDLVRMDNNGHLHYQGRKDHQIKLHGQRIELGEIERCLLNTSISACVVMKWGDDHLVAYVQSSDMNETQLREHCQSHLPLHMIPSIFILLDKLPLNANGKIDRRQLPEPNFGSLSVSTNEDEYMEPKNALEMQIHSVWSDILQRTHISTNTNFFNIGGHSLLLVQLYHRYKTIFEFDTHSINIAEMIEYSTIADHARLIRHSTNAVKCDTVSWFLLRFNSNDSIADGLSSSSGMKLYVRRQNIVDPSQDVTTNIEELEKTYLSAIIQEIYIMYIDDPRSNENHPSKQLLAAVIVSQADEMFVLEELEIISRLKQFSFAQMLQAVLIEKKSLKVAEGSRLSLLENIDRETLENRYRTKMLNILLKHENVECETIDMSSNTVQQQMASSRLLIETDMVLDPALQPSIETINKMSSNDIFLTGSTGFLGAYLLDELLKQTDANIYCLVRSISSTNTFQSRVFYLHGDLTLPHLGLDEHQYSMLVSKIRSIYHCAAVVNFIKPYTKLRAANVLGTVELIKLSYLANCRINYISTLDVLDRNTQSGYVQSKQVAERLLEQASERGLLVTILRPGFISWCSSTGDFNRTDWVTLLLLDLIKLGSAPESDCTFNITPVDQMSKTIVELGESEKTMKATINLSHTHTTTFKAIWTEICQQRKMEPHFINVAEWCRKLDEQLKTDSQSFRGLQLFSNALTNPFSHDTVATIGAESDLNISIFVKSLLRN